MPTFTRLLPGLLLASLLLASLLFSSSPTAATVPAPPLTGKTIVVDAGHGGTAATDPYRQGPGGEREEWINLRVAQELKPLLETGGARVVMTREDDRFVPLDERARIARDNHADLFLSIHHNATADPQVNFPILYFHGNASENLAGVALARALSTQFRDQFQTQRTEASVVSDHTIFATAGAGVLRQSYGIPGVLAEASFFTHAPEEARLKTRAYNRREAEAYYAAVLAFFAEPAPPIHPKHSRVPALPPFRGLQEAERMGPEARQWREQYERGLALAARDDPASLEQAYEAFTRSARAFPDSPLAGASHARRAQLLQRLGRDEEARTEAIRAREHYVEPSPAETRNE